MAVSEILLALAAIVGSIYLWCKHRFNFWKRQNMPYAEPAPFVGNAGVVFTMKKSFGLHLADIYSDPKFANEAAVGIYAMHQPGLLLRDPELIKKVLIKDFNKFSNRAVSTNQDIDPLAFYNLFFVKNPYWREIRQKLSPVFTSGKIKQMYPLMLDIATDLEQHLLRYKKENTTFVTNVKEICAKFTTDLIATIAFGIRANSLQNPEAEFRKYGKKIFETNLKNALDFFIGFFMPNLVKMFRVKIFPDEFTNYIRKTFSHVINERETTGNKRNDLIDVLIGLKKDFEMQEDPNHYGNHKDFLLAQAVVFLTAGFETSSTTMSFCLYELAKAPKIQEKLREEIFEAFVAGDGELSYETINSLEYLSMVIDETLRKYPVLPFLDRVFEKKAGEADFSLKPFYDYAIPHCMPVFISSYGIQHDPKYWPEPEKFDPERFRDRSSIDPITFLAFGDGPHNCIGKRIGILQAKIGLVYMLRNHRVELNDKKMVVKMDPKMALLSFIGDLNLKIVNDNMYGNRNKA